MPIYLTQAQLEDKAMVAMGEAAAKDLGTELVRESVSGLPGGPRHAENGEFVAGIRIPGVDNAFTPAQDANAVHISLFDSANETKFKAARWAMKLSNRPIVIDPASGVMDVLDLKDRGIHISYTDAQDSAKYRRARAIAAEKGQSLIIDEPHPASFVADPNAIAVPKSASAAQYRAAKAEAERTGKTIQIVD